MENIPRFADLLTAALQRIKRLEGKKLAVIQDEIGYALGRDSGGSVIEYWRKGNQPASLGEVEALCQHLRQRTDFDQEWFRLFLRAANHPYPEVVYQQLFAAPPAGSPAAAVRAPVGDFVGREEERGRIVAWLSQSGPAGPILAIRGMGGVGKTELAYAAAQPLSQVFSDGVVALPLGGTTPAPMTVAQALQAAIRAVAADERLPDDIAGLQALYHASLKSRRILLIADDAYDAAQVRPLIPPAGSALLITTRRRFTLPGLEIVDLETLSGEASRRLLTAICPRIGRHAATLSQLCGYLPLALRVSASLLFNDDTYPVVEYLAQLADERTRLQHLRDPDDDELDVAASLNLSFAELAADEQLGLSQLCVFPDSFDFAAAEAVIMGVGQPARAILSQLRRQNLLEYDQHLDRYRLHDLVRAFGGRQLEDHRGTSLRYARHFAERTIALHDLYMRGGAEVLVALQQFDRERIHIDTAWRWLREQPADPAIDELILKFNFGTIFLGDLRYSIRHERVPLLENGLAAARRSGDRRMERICLGNLGRAFLELDEIPRAIGCYRETLELARSGGSRAAEANALDNLAQALILQSDLLPARAYLEQAVTIAREIGAEAGEAASLNNLGVVLLRQGRIGPAIVYLRQAHSLLLKVGYQRGLAWNDIYLGMAYADSGDLQQALAVLSEGMVIARHLSDRAGEIQLTAYLGWVALKQQAFEAAEQQLSAALAGARQIEERHLEAWVLRKLSILAYRRGQVEQSAQCFLAAKAIPLGQPDLWELAQDSWVLGTMLAQAGNIAAALPLLERWTDYQARVDHVHKARDLAYLQGLRAQLGERSTQRRSEGRD
jgi:tetratricopeptide (TPR) repeat protein